MPMNGQSVGKDVSFTLTTSTGVLDVPAAAVTNFDAQPVTTNEKRVGLDGKPRHIVTPSGWSGSLTIDRLSSAIDDYWAQVEDDYYSGLNIRPGQITETISNPDGSISQFRYTDVVFDLKNIGSRQGDKPITQQLDWMASRRIRLA